MDPYTNELVKTIIILEKKIARLEASNNGELSYITQNLFDKIDMEQNQFDKTLPDKEKEFKLRIIQEIERLKKEHNDKLNDILDASDLFYVHQNINSDVQDDINNQSIDIYQKLKKRLFNLQLSEEKSSNTITELAANIDRLSKENSHLEQKVIEQNHKLVILSSSYDNLVKLQTDLEIENIEMNKLKADNIALRLFEEAFKSQEDAEGNQNKIKDLIYENSNLVVENQDLNKKIQELTTLNVNLTIEINEIEDLKNQQINFQEENRRLNDALDELKTQHEQLQKGISTSTTLNQ